MEEQEFKFLKTFNSALLDAIPISVLLIDPRLNVFFANKNFYQKTKKRREDVINQKIDSIFPPAFISSSNLREKLLEVMEGNSMREGEIKFRRFTYHYQINQLFDENYNIYNAILLFIDITRERLLSEEIMQVERHLANIVESANDLVFSCDKDGRIITWNRAARKTLLYSLEEAQGRYFAHLCYEKDRDRIREEFTSLKGKLKEVSSCEMFFPTKEGKEVLISWSFGVIHDIEGNPVGIMGVGRDLTEQRRMEAQMIQSAKMASLGTMAGGMAHELRNPLAIVSSAAQLLLRRSNDDFIHECAKRIHKNVKRAAEIIENLLRFSQVSSAEKQQVDVQSAIDETLSLINHQISLDGIKIIWEYAPEPLMTMANKNRLQQVFMNLVINAAEAMESSGRLIIKAERDERHVIIKFIDNGRGISDEHIQRIFDPFFTTKTSGRNTGLGLFVSFGIIKSFDGDIFVESKKGEDTTFTIKLPAL